MLKIQIVVRNFLRIIITALGIGKTSILQLAKHDNSDAENFRILSRDFSKYRRNESCQDSKEQDLSKR